MEFSKQPAELDHPPWFLLEHFQHGHAFHALVNQPVSSLDLDQVADCGSFYPAGMDGARDLLLVFDIFETEPVMKEFKDVPSLPLMNISGPSAGEGWSIEIRLMAYGSPLVTLRRRFWVLCHVPQESQRFLRDVFHAVAG